MRWVPPPARLGGRRGSHPSCRRRPRGAWHRPSPWASPGRLLLLRGGAGQAGPVPPPLPPPPGRGAAQGAVRAHPQAAEPSRGRRQDGGERAAHTVRHRGPEGGEGWEAPGLLRRNRKPRRRRRCGVRVPGGCRGRGGPAGLRSIPSPPPPAWGGSPGHRGSPGAPRREAARRESGACEERRPRRQEAAGRRRRRARQVGQRGTRPEKTRIRAFPAPRRGGCVRGRPPRLRGPSSAGTGRPGTGWSLPPTAAAGRGSPGSPFYKSAPFCHRSCSVTRLYRCRPLQGPTPFPSPPSLCSSPAGARRVFPSALVL